MRTLMILLSACGVEETGFLTDEGVWFTEDGTDGLVVVRPEAAERLGGELSITTLDGDPIGTGILSGTGLAWSIGQADSVRLTYTLEGTESVRELDVVLAGGAAPSEDPQSLMAEWVVADGDGLVVDPSILLGQLPFLVVNLSNGASVVIEVAQPTPLDGGSGDRVCISSLMDAAATSSLCRDVP